MPQPNGPIVLNQIWTPAQWNAAWDSVATDIATAIAPLATSASVIAAIAAAIAASPGTTNVGRNLLQNGEFLIQQRGTGSFTANGAYSADRWLQELSTSTLTTTIAALADADRTAIGDEAALFRLNCVVGGTAGAGDFALVEQRLEGVQRYGGKSVTVTFWAKVSSGTASIGVGAVQNFGSGGSPSSPVTVNATSVAVTTTWTRYTVTKAIPTTIGKTLGTTAGSDYTAIRLWLSSGATNNTAAGGIGVQSPTVQIWGTQAEIGTASTPFEKKSWGQHWQDCLRFYVGAAPAHAAAIAAAAGALTSATVSFPAPMRIVPTIAFVSNIIALVNAATPTGDLPTAMGFRTFTSSTASGAFGYDSLFSASADL